MANINPSAPKTIVIAAGQTIVLPKGITIQSVVADGDATLESTCDTPEPTNYECYGFVTIAQDDSGPATEPFQIYGNNAGLGNIRYIGTLINGVRKNFSTEIVWDDKVGLQAALLAASPLIKTAFVTNQFNGQRGHKRYIMIKTIPSVGENIQLIGKTVLTNVAGDGVFEYMMPAKTPTVLEAENNESVPACS